MQSLQARRFVQCLQLFQRDGIAHMQTARFHAAQHGQMSAAAQCIANIFAQGADVGAFGTAHAQMQLGRFTIQLHVQQLQIVDHHLSRRAFYRFAVTGIFVQCLAIFFKGAVHGRHLSDGAGKVVQHLHHLPGRTAHRALLHHFAFGIGGGGVDPQAHDGFVGFVGFELQLAEFGGRAKAQGQHATGKRIERAGVTSFFGAQ